MAWIIVKYAKDHYPDGVAPKSASIFDTHTAKMCKITKEEYYILQDAQNDLEVLQEYNPSVHYGIVEGV